MCACAVDGDGAVAVDGPAVRGALVERYRKTVCLDGGTPARNEPFGGFAARRRDVKIPLDTDGGSLCQVPDAKCLAAAALDVYQCLCGGHGDAFFPIVFHAEDKAAAAAL